MTVKPPEGTGTPLKRMMRALVKFVPVSTTSEPGIPLVGVKPVNVGKPGVAIVKLALLVAVPPGVRTVTGPLVAPEGIENTLIWVGEVTLKLLVGTPLKRTVVAPVKFVPKITIDEKTAPLLGLKLVMVGAAAALTVKLPVLVTAPPGVTTVIGPDVAAAGILRTVICVGESTTNAWNPVTGTPLMRTALAPVKFVPVITKLPPGTPLVGVKLAMVGAAGVATVKFPALVAMPPLVTTVIGPVVALEGTVT